ncbi:MAG: MerR family transcriptional regulator [Rhodoferax ferrireducens]|uniref:MerR family transcriptional regulator n=1 Tax=Rhodoferax ferrireducens TaxID=192843 RepID=A0A1W9KP68_9BURK|nr:MAG: MerR family transcriptional regulator [Rhodoferax ferrireducens]
MSEPPASYTLNELCVLADLPVRTLRYYVQNGLIDRPDGETRAARYGAKHLEQALLVRKWTAAGLSLERIRDILHGQEVAVTARPKAPGSIEVCSHLCIADGLEMVIEPTRAGMTPEQVRTFAKGVMALYAAITSTQEVPSSTQDKQI